MSYTRNMIAKNIAGLLHDGDLVNLGVGIPTLVGNYLPEGISILLHGENGCIGQDRELQNTWDISDRNSVIKWLQDHGDIQNGWRDGHRDLNNASSAPITLIPGACCFDSALSFVIARGGHVDVTVLGGLQVDAQGNLANWTVPGKQVNGMGGAMDLVNGAKKVIVAMEHCSKKGEPKLLENCTMPLTAIHCVKMVVTELCIIEFQQGVPVVIAMAPDLSKDELQDKTGMKLTFAPEIREMELPN